jgi:hypothetical protein
MIRRFALWLIAPLALAGCADIAPPRIFHPGSAEYQQNRAQTFDPYPLTDVAPEVVGGRPLQYIRPAPENERTQNEMTFEERYHQAPPPGTYRAPRLPGNRQPIVYPAPGPPLVVQPPGQQPPVVPLPPGTAPPFVPN